MLTNVIANADVAAARGPAIAKDAKLDILEAAEGNDGDDGGGQHRDEQQTKGKPKQHRQGRRRSQHADGGQRAPNNSRRRLGDAGGRERIKGRDDGFERFAVQSKRAKEEK